MLGWPRFRAVLPNGAHRALAALERRGQVGLLVTQNVDRLHQRAGSQCVLDLHGRLDRVRCMSCGTTWPRDDYQRELLATNPAWAGFDAATAPDGDAELDGQDFSSFVVPSCLHCGGIVKPDVVFFGEAVPRERIDAASHAWQAADAVLVVGSSLMVYSGYRFVRAAALAGKPVAAITLGHTRADPLLTLKLDGNCSDALAFLDPVQLQARPEAAGAQAVPAP
jgi:NAD-dependent SIR2 family protein deacetylase